MFSNLTIQQIANAQGGQGTRNFLNSTTKVPARQISFQDILLHSFILSEHKNAVVNRLNCRY